MTNIQAAKTLGWFSIGLGAVQLTAPRWLGEQIGVGHHPGVMRAFGARETASGALILARPHEARRIWARTAGDLLDLAALGASAKEGNRQRLMAATAMVAGVTAIDYAVARRLEQEERNFEPIEPVPGYDTVH